MSAQFTSIFKQDDEILITDGIGLSKNQTRLIKDILYDKNEFRTSTFLDIKPLLKDNFYLEISKKKKGYLTEQYEAVFECLSQHVCKAMAKEWIKTICPRKQAIFPYKYSEIPEWWPKHIPHIEPDHLDKNYRIQLLIGIIRHKSVDLTKLKAAVNNLDFIYKSKRPGKTLNNDFAFHLIYELFYMNLYERLFFNYGIDANLDLLDELSPSEVRRIKTGSRIFIKVSSVQRENSIKLFQQVDINSFTYRVKVKPEDDPDELNPHINSKPSEIKVVITQEHTDFYEGGDMESDGDCKLKLEQEINPEIGEIGQYERRKSFHLNSEDGEQDLGSQNGILHTKRASISHSRGKNIGGKVGKPGKSSALPKSTSESKLNRMTYDLGSPLQHTGRVLFQDDGGIDMSPVASLKHKVNLDSNLHRAENEHLDSFSFQSDNLDIRGSAVTIRPCKKDNSEGEFVVDNSNSSRITSVDSESTILSTSSSSSSNSTGFSTPIPMYAEYIGESWTKSPVLSPSTNTMPTANNLLNSPGVMLITSPMYGVEGSEHHNEIFSDDGFGAC